LPVKTVKTPQEWLEIRTEFEAGASGLSNKAFADKYGLVLGTLNSHRTKEGWAPKGSITPEQIDSEVSTIAADMGEAASQAAMEAELIRLREELAQLKPVEVEYPVDLETAARILATDLPTQVEDMLVSFNRDRAKNHLAPFTIDQMEAIEPGWAQKQRDRLLQEAVNQLTEYATSTGPSPRKIVMLDKSGNLKQIVCEPGINNYDPSKHDEYIRWHEARGFRRVTPQPCPRLDCWAMQKPEFDHHCTLLHQQLEVAFRGKVHTGVTTTASFATA